MKPTAVRGWWSPIPMDVCGGGRLKPSSLAAFGKSVVVGSKPTTVVGNNDKTLMDVVGGKKVETRRKRIGVGDEEQVWNWMLKVLQSREADDNGEDCSLCRINDEDEFDRASFSKLLRRVSLTEARLYSQMAYLGHLTYSIPNIKPGKLLNLHGLRFVTSSMEMKKKEEVNSSTFRESETQKKNMGSSSGTSYLHPPKPANLTAVVAAEEEVKQAVANDITSQWFICDHDQTQTRYILIQGSNSLASWKANLLFEPIQFEGYKVLVHRGIYEAAKGIYQQILPEIRLHLKSNGNRATFRLGGHSLGGSISVLVSLMLLVRGQVPRSSLLPVVTFGSPSIMCGGDAFLKELGLPRSHVQAIILHRDIIPRAFSCRYPTRLIKLLKAVNVNFRNLPCLDSQNLLYAPMGEFLILQPGEKLSPSHDLLPAGCGLYILSCCQTIEEPEVATKIRAAKNKFLNSPHPLEILSKRSSYGSDGTIIRDHHMKIYMKCISYLIRQELRQMKETETGPHSSYMLDVLQAWKESLSLIVTQNIHLFVLLLLQSRLILSPLALDAYNDVIFH